MIMWAPTYAAHLLIKMLNVIGMILLIIFTYLIKVGVLLAYQWDILTA